MEVRKRGRAPKGANVRCFMDEKQLRGMVERAVLCELARAGESFVPVNSSNRHIHLSQTDVERLFGDGYQLTKMRDLVQPGQFACNERVTLETEKGKLTLRVVGPARKQTQIELSMTEAVKLGLKAPVRMSGELTDSPGCTLANGERRISLSCGVIVAARHLHLAPEEAACFGLRDGDVVELVVDGQRAATLGNVIVRSGEKHLMEAHIDKDEANACGLTDGQLCRVRKVGGCAPAPYGAPQAHQPGATHALAPAPCVHQPNTEPAPALHTYAPPARPENTPTPPAPKKSTMLDLSPESRRLITEDDVRKAALDGVKVIRYAPDAILTQLARDAASDRGIELAEAI